MRGSRRRSFMVMAAATLVCASPSLSFAQSSLMAPGLSSDYGGRLYLPVEQAPAAASGFYQTSLGNGSRPANRLMPTRIEGSLGHREREMRNLPPHKREDGQFSTDIEMFSTLSREFAVRGGEVLAIDMDRDLRRAAEENGFEILRSSQLESVGVSLHVLRPPRGMSVKHALAALRKADPDGSYEPNSLFEGSGAAPTLLPLAAASAGTARLGLIDTGVFADRSAFSLSKVRQRNFGRGEDITPREHGTYVAALSVRYGVGELLVADAFSGVGEFTDAESLARALNWLANEDVAVINMSLAGPPSKLLEITVARLIKQGHTIVAAVGNDGPDTAPQYPAAYPSVIGVTAVDRQLKVYEKANRGKDVDVAFIGVNVLDASEGRKSLSGTSFATPAIAAFLAHNIDAPEPGAANRLGSLVENLAIDLGAPGKDPVYGAGFLSLEPPSRPTYGPTRLN